MADRIASTDTGYISGDLSLYPEILDDKDSLYEVTNNAKVRLRQTLTYSGKRIVVEDTDGFPDKGLLRVGSEDGVDGRYELIYYGRKTGNTFEDLLRGFAGSRQSQWEAAKFFASISVCAEPENAVKDALIKMQLNVGLSEAPASDSLNGILKAQEVRFLSPKPFFRAFPTRGPAPLKVRFQNFSTGYIIRHLWDFGDGGTSLERNPTHTFLTEGKYTIKLNITTSTGAQGVVTKTDYIVVNNDEALPFFYVDSLSDPYSQQTADELMEDAKEFLFVDQSDGDIVQRNWVFGDGTSFTQEDPDIHQATHIYEEPGEYIVTELIQYANGRLKRVELPSPLTVL